MPALDKAARAAAEAVVKAALPAAAAALVAATSAQRTPSSPTHVTNPRVVFEVLSAGTELYDRGEKREHYQRIETLREYLLLSQTTQRIELWSRATTSDAWSYAVYGPGDVVDLHSMGCRLDVNELYLAAGIANQP